ncbi:MAG: TrkA C-terminal domain-containing protein [Pirellulaceae bacterium]
MLGVFSLLIALSVSLIVTRIAALALMFTGLSREAARFQARSAFSGCGYTTREAETIVNHPVRRKIVMILMLLGNIGIATVVATIMISFSSTVGESNTTKLTIMGWLSLGIILIYFLFSSRWVERQMNKVIAWALKRFTDLEVRDYQSLLQLADGYAVSEMVVESNHWIVGKELKDMRLADEGILILGIHRSPGGFKGIPKANDVVATGDALIIYGQLENVRQLDRRKPGEAGDRVHRDQVKKQSVESAKVDADFPKAELAPDTSTESEATNVASK